MQLVVLPHPEVQTDDRIGLQGSIPDQALGMGITPMRVFVSLEIDGGVSLLSEGQGGRLRLLWCTSRKIVMSPAIDPRFRIVSMGFMTRAVGVPCPSAPEASQRSGRLSLCFRVRARLGRVRDSSSYPRSRACSSRAMLMAPSAPVVPA